jgi:hypothetical protein
MNMIRANHHVPGETDELKVIGTEDPGNSAKVGDHLGIVLRSMTPDHRSAKLL